MVIRMFQYRRPPMGSEIERVDLIWIAAENQERLPVARRQPSETLVR